MMHLSSLSQKLTGLLLLLLPLSPALAQVPMSGYQLTALSGTYAALPVSATDVPTLQSDDVLSPLLPLPFPFTFGGTSYTSVVVSSNGFLTFNPTVNGPSLSNNLATASSNLRPLVAPFWDDLDGRPTATDPTRASYQTTGTAPNRVFTFEWLNWSIFAVAPIHFLSFQVRLYETTNVVEFSYQPGTSAFRAPSASIGLAGASNGDFLSLANTSAAPTASFVTENSNLYTRPAAGQIYRFTPPAAGACLPVSGLAVGSSTSTTAQVQFSAPAGTTGLQLSYQPVGGGPSTTLSPAPTASSVTLTGLLPGTAYQVTVQTVCGASMGINPAVILVHTAPANDEPAAATPLPVSSTCQPTVGSLGYATVSAPNGYTNPGLCASSTSITPYDVWYSFQTAAGAPGSGNVRVAVSGLHSSGGLRLFSTSSGTSSGPFQEVACGALYNGTVDYTGLTPAATYFLSLSTSSASQLDTLNSFSICLTPVPACTPPTQLQVGSITSSSAVLTLQPGNGNSSYTVTYQPLPGGSPITVVATSLPIVLAGLTDGQRYAVSVQANCSSGPAGSPLVAYFNTSSLAAPANDEPATATPLTLGSTCQPTTSTTTGATASAVAASMGCGATGIGGSGLRDVWFSFQTAATPALQNVLISVAGRPAGQVRLYDGTSRLACSAGAGANQPAPALTGSNLAAAHTYLISVSGYSATDTTGTFTICVTALAPTVSPANDACAQATPLPVGSTCTPLVATTTNATASTGLPVSCLPASSADVWFRVVVPASGGLTLTTSAAPAGTATPLTDTELEVYDGSCGALRSLGCNDDFNGSLFARLGLSGLAPGTPLLVRAAGFANRSGSFGICATDGTPRPCATPTGLSAMATSTTSVTVSFVAAPGSTGFRLVYAPLAGGTAQQAYAVTSPVVLSGLLPNTQYSLSIFTSCDSIRSTTPVIAAPGSTTFTSRPAGPTATATSALAAEVVLYPNPAHTSLTLDLPAALAAEPGTATLTTALGQTVLTRTWSAQNGPLHLPLSVRQLAAGVYWLRLQTVAGPLVRRVVVE